MSEMTYAVTYAVDIAVCVVFVVLAIVLTRATVRIAMEYQRGIVFRFGRYNVTRGPGLFFLIPWVDRVIKMDLRVQTNEIENQEMITKDSISLVVSAVVFFRVRDPKNALIEVEDYLDAIDQYSLTSLRSVIGSSTLDQVLGERERVANEARKLLDEVTEPWGVESQRVEIRQIELPENMKRAMGREAEALREKRARITKAEGEFEASKKLAEAAEQIAASPGAMELRRLQMMSEVGAEHNSTIVVGIPQELLALARKI